MSMSMQFSAGRYQGWLEWPEAWTNNVILLCAAMLLLDEWRRKR